jgi:dienelactone hydrolase
MPNEQGVQHYKSFQKSRRTPWESRLSQPFSRGERNITDRCSWLTQYQQTLEGISRHLARQRSNQLNYVPIRGINNLAYSWARYTTLLYPAKHAFARDVGSRFDPEATDLVFAETVRLFRRVFLG